MDLRLGCFPAEILVDELFTNLLLVVCWVIFKLGIVDCDGISVLFCSSVIRVHLVVGSVPLIKYSSLIGQP